MSGINSAIRITDGMSPALKSMNKALSIVLGSFERVQAISGNAIDVSDIRDARTELANAATAVNRLEEELRQAENAQEELTNEARKTESAMGGLVQKIAGAVAAYASFQSLMGLVNLSDSMSQTSSRLSLIVDVDENASRAEIEKATEGLEEKIFASANRSRSAYLDTAAAVAAFAQRAGDAFSGNDEVIAFTETLNKMYVIAGATQEEQTSSMLQLTQALGSGVLRGEEFNAVFEAAPNIMQAVATYMDIPIGQLRTMAEEGKITADVVKNAIFSATENVNEDFENMKWTWQQVFTTFKNYAIQSLDPVLSKISELANNPDVQNFAIGLGNAVSMVGSMLLWIFELIAMTGSFLYENWAIISPVIYGVAAALAVYYGYLLITKTIEGISTAIKIGLMLASYAHAAATGAEASATAAATAAQYGFNTALLACPIVWILLIIIAVIAAIYLVIGVINKVTGESISATGVIVGALAAAGAFIWNLFLSILDIAFIVINNLYNKFAMFANFFANLFRDPIGSIIHLFGDMADGVLGVLENIAKAMDKIFGSNMADTVSGWRDGLDSLVESAANKHGNGSYEKVMEEINLSSDSLGLKRIEYSTAWDAGYSAGESIEEKLSLDSIFSAGDDLAAGLANNDLLNGLGTDIGNIADDTGSISDSMEIAEEDLKYMRDIAEQEAINRFTTAEIRIDMQNNNSISSGMDIDGIVMQLEDKLYESMEIAAEGVY